MGATRPILTALAALAAVEPTTVMAGPMTIAGGELDPAFEAMDVYHTVPASAAVPPVGACRLAARYVELINGGEYLAAAALFHDDATFLEPMRPTLKGRTQIDGFYTRTIASMKPHVIAVAYTGDDHQCMVALANRFEAGGRVRYHLASVDHFITREDGMIDSMVAFSRPR